MSKIFQHINRYIADRKQYLLLRSATIAWIFLVFIITTSIWGCGKVETITEYYPIYKEVKIPVVCTVDIPHKPKYSGDTVRDNLNILEYTEKLKNALDACIDKAH